MRKTKDTQYQILMLSGEGKIFIDELEGEKYRSVGKFYRDSIGEELSNSKEKDFHPTNLPGLVDGNAQEEFYWVDHEIFRPIKFDSLEDAEYYADHLISALEQEELEKRRIH